jgi:predicted nucleic acid-binding protein
VRFFVSQYILDEVATTLLEDFDLPPRYVALARRAIQRVAKTIRLPIIRRGIVARDPDDDAIVQTALKAKADYLVTADRVLLDLRPVAAADSAKVRQWIADLGNDDFAIRETATKELQKLGDQIISPVKKAMQPNESLESRRRLDRILDTIPDIPAPATLRAIRAIAVLERIGSADARGVLETLARGAPGARETEEAKAALKNLATRPVLAR